MNTTKTLQHTWKKGLPFKVQVAIHIDEKNGRYWLEINGCQETEDRTIQNIEV